MRYRADATLNNKRSELEDKQLRHLIDSTHAVNGDMLKVGTYRVQSR